jgi:hypothetical protein
VSPDCSDNTEKNTSTTSSSTSSTTSRRYVRRLCLAILGGSSSHTRVSYRQCSGARHQLAPECGTSYSRSTTSASTTLANDATILTNARGLDINSPRSAKNHPQDLRFHRHQQRDDPSDARGLDNNFASDLDCDSTTTTRLHHRRLRRVDYAAPDKS